ncbi:hypothetical protein CALCODRAFT_481333 [Calocera cornea HHB12733]|uniref:DNA 3'-5' helicase n=1 Tax=Calocera cornea HHB12733 TaxID=1353952 RepID=A0A165HQV4_9BASI|nr:hypothetical protein CALCODRAFT_481333 [Calocera cornea HHB12733]
MDAPAPSVSPNAGPTFAFPCLHCPSGFDTASKRDNHGRLVHQRHVFLTFPNGEVYTVHRALGVFNCPATACETRCQTPSPAVINKHWTEQHLNTNNVSCDGRWLRRGREDSTPVSYPPAGSSSSTAHGTSSDPPPEPPLPEPSTPVRQGDEERQRDGDTLQDDPDSGEESASDDDQEDAPDGLFEQAGSQFDPIQTSLREHPVLAQFGYALSMPLGIIICQQCSTGVSTDALAAHYDTHRIRGAAAATPQTFAPVLEQYTVRSVDEAIPNLVYMQVPGLPNPKPGFLCKHRDQPGAPSDCKLPKGSRSSFRRHLDKHHALTVHQENRIDSHSEPCLVQTFFGFRGYRAARPFLVQRAHLGDVQHDNPPGMAEFLVQQQAMMTECSPLMGNVVNIKAKSHFNMRTRWHTLLVGHDPERLSALPSLTADPALEEGHLGKHVADACRAYIRDVHSTAIPLLDGSNVLRRLCITSGPFTCGPKHGAYLTPNSTDQLGRSIANIVHIVGRLLGRDRQSYPTFHLCLGPRAYQSALALVERLYDGEDFSIELHAFLLAVVQGKQTSTAVAWSPLDRFLLLISLEPTGSFQDAPTMSHLVTSFKHLVRDVLCKDIAEFAPHDVERQVARVIEHAPFYSEGHLYPFHALQHLSAIVTAITYNQPPPPDANWTADEKNIRLGSLTISVESVRSGIPQIVAEAKQLLVRALRGLQFAPFDSYLDDVFAGKRTLADDIANQTAGYSFLTEPKNHELAQYRDQYPLIRAALFHDAVTPGVKRIFTLPGAQLAWNHVAIMAWLRELRAAKLAVLVAMHVTGGGVCRGTESVNMRIVNDYLGMRTFGVLDARAVVLRGHHKRSWSDSSNTISMRWFPKEVSRLVFYFLAVIIPTEAFFLHMLDGRDAGQLASNYFITELGTRLVDSTALSSTLTAMTRQHLGVGLGLQQYRQVVQALMPIAIGISVDDLGPDDEEDDGLDMQSGHTALTRRTHYHRDAARVTLCSASRLDMMRTISFKWHAWTGFVQPDGPTALPPAPHAALRIPPIPPPSMDVDSLAARLSGPLTAVVTAALATTPAPLPPSVSVPRADPGRYPATASDLAVLRRMTGDPGAAFRSPEQALFCSMLLRGTKHILAVLPTAAGKTFSTTFLWHGGHRDNIIVFIAPLVLLLDQTRARLTKAQVPVHAWVSGKPVSPGVLVVTVDDAKEDVFLNWVAAEASYGKLTHIVLDEAHQLLISPAYRAVFLRLAWLSVASARVVLLTATLPIRHELPLIRAIGLVPDIVDVVRARSSARPQLEFVVVRTRSPQMTKERVLTHVRDLPLAADERGIVLCRSKDDAHTLGGLLNAPVYVGDLDHDHRRQAQAEWEAGNTSRWLVGTTAMEQGADHDKVRHVVFYGAPHGITSFAQGAGRGGRKIPHCTVTVFYSSAPNVPPENDPEDYAGIVPLARLLADDSTCRQLGLSRYFDTHPAGCAAFSCPNLCDVCERDMGEASAAATAKRRPFEDLESAPKRARIEAPQARVLPTRAPSRQAAPSPRAAPADPSPPAVPLPTPVGQATAPAVATVPYHAPAAHAPPQPPVRTVAEHAGDRLVAYVNMGTTLTALDTLLLSLRPEHEQKTCVICTFAQSYNLWLTSHGNPAPPITMPATNPPHRFPYACALHPMLLGFRRSDDHEHPKKQLWATFSQIQTNITPARTICWLCALPWNDRHFPLHPRNQTCPKDGRYRDTVKMLAFLLFDRPPLLRAVLMRFTSPEHIETLAHDRVAYRNWLCKACGWYGTHWLQIVYNLALELEWM